MRDFRDGFSAGSEVQAERVEAEAVADAAETLEGEAEWLHGA